MTRQDMRMRERAREILELNRKLVTLETSKGSTARHYVMIVWALLVVLWVVSGVFGTLEMKKGRGADRATNETGLPWGHLEPTPGP